MTDPLDDVAGLRVEAALQLAQDMRGELAAAHRTVRHMGRLELEQVACVLAAALPVDIPWSSLAWWRLSRGGEAA